MKARQLDREIEVVETIISQLNQCVGIYRNAGSRIDLKNTLKDIAICKAELKKLVAAKKAEMEADEGAATDVSLERSGEIISQ
jgi:hypothetical protein